MNNKIIIDLDNTLCFTENSDYSNAIPNTEAINKLNEYKNKYDYQILIFTSRNMNTYDNNIEKINQYTVPTITKWLKKFKVPYDELIIGKPWCGPNGFYVDDKAIRPDEFVKMNHDDIQKIINK